MPRKGPAPKRPVVVDPVYGSPLVSQLVSKILLSGKKTVAQHIVYSALEGTREKTGGADPVQTLKRALDNVRPGIEVKSRRVGGATYQVPMEVRAERRQTLGLRWLTQYARNRGEKTMRERLAGEIMDAVNSQGNSVKRRDDTHKMAEANRAFAHYRW
jgi:small subunit ribosomal protein S7